ncbi:MAG: succinylglutamate-semialdehyde dehydrogenase [Planctomycetota bacterium]
MSFATASYQDTFTSLSPATGEVVWRGRAAGEHDIAAAVTAARDAQRAWGRTPIQERIGVAQRFAGCAAECEAELADIISRETGKPLWEAASEARLVPAKVRLAIQALHERTGDHAIELPQGFGRVIHRPLGVVAVLGPFNFPAHLPNGHIVPALLAGNAVVFKPSEYTPATGDLLVEIWREAGLPDGVLRVCHGARPTGSSLVSGDIDAVFFTGSAAGGQAIHRALAGRPDVLLALEMGGNNPLVIHEVCDLDAAAYLTAISAFITAGQRCTCARRLILPDGPAVAPLLDRLVAVASSLRVGPPTHEPEPFYGPVIHAEAGRRILGAQADWLQRGAAPLLRAEARSDNAALISPGILDVTDRDGPDDGEVFGPLLQVIRVPDFNAAIDEANRTRFGLAASLLSDDAACFSTFRERVRAGIVNWNQPTTGASGRLPFGGLGASGNHRPSGYHVADFCADATAAVESHTLEAPASTPPGISTAPLERPN